MWRGRPSYNSLLKETVGKQEAGMSRGELRVPSGPVLRLPSTSQDKQPGNSLLCNTFTFQ